MIVHNVTLLIIFWKKFLESFSVHSVKLLLRKHGEKFPAEVKRLFYSTVFVVALFYKLLLERLAEFKKTFVVVGELVLTDN